MRNFRLPSAPRRLGRALIKREPENLPPGMRHKRGRLAPGCLCCCLSTVAATVLVLDMHDDTFKNQKTLADLFDGDSGRIIFDVVCFALSVAAAVLALAHCIFNIGPVSEQMNDYDLLRRLGEGGFGEVWHAKHQPSGEDVAVKFLTVGGTEGMNDAIKESLRLETCKHENVVHLKDMFVYFKGIRFVRGFCSRETPWSLCMVLEYCDGGTLGTKIKQWAGESQFLWPVADTALNIYILNVAKGLSHMHSRGVAHLDLKPDNVLLSADLTRIKICDLGLATEYGVDTDVFCGTVGYVAPEIWRKDPHDAKADMWSLGCILVDIMHPNHEGGWSVVQEVARVRGDRNLPKIDTMTSDINQGYGNGAEESIDNARAIIMLLPRIAKSRNVVEVLNKLLVEDPDTRWSSDELVNALDPT